MNNHRSVVVRLKSVSKRFGPVAALRDVDLVVASGRIMGLLGENGAGKSTLMKILYGLYSPDEGEIYIDGKAVRFRSPQDSILYGIGMVHQVSTLVPEFTGLENIVLGTREGRFQFSLTRERKKIQTLSAQFGLLFPLDQKVSALTAGEKQKIEIVRALYRGARVLILDEPTTSLVESEFVQLLTSLRRFVDGGVTVVFITHKIREVMAACDEVTVLRRGEVQGNLQRHEMTKDSLVKLMFMDRNIAVTESALPLIDHVDVALSLQPVLSFDGVSTSTLRDLSFQAYGGEIVGVAAVSGNGEKDFAELPINPKRITKGTASLMGSPINGWSTVDVLRQGVFYTPEDRNHEGVLNEGSIVENMLLGHHRDSRFTRWGHFVDWPRLRLDTEASVSAFNVATPDIDVAIRRLSGGNVQKTILARAFLRDPRLLIVHNPTSGLDISTVEFIFSRLEGSRQAGMAIVWVNEDLDELMMLSDRIVVLNKGRIHGTFVRGEFDKLAIGASMLGESA
ncbi:MAG: ATP-binding cassette domain-containing protein [Spirochaetaceae bacterium]|nr:MAG: ATP-binding cassette domain-containing protein [Spirochaetaceae bacterium]